MDRDYWNSLAETYERDLLEIAEEHEGGVLAREIEALAGEGRRVADLGCGPGSLLPFLAERFQQVFAVDYSEGLLKVARERTKSQNVSFHCHDLGAGDSPGIEVEVCCCVNALIDPDRGKREGMLGALAEVTASGGALVVVVPALESVFHVYHTLLRCRRREGAGSGLGLKKAEKFLRAEVDSFVGGLVKVGGVLTKYWMREELTESLREHGLVSRRVCRVEYPWAEEVEDPPAWMGSPGPWDWLVVADRAPREG